MNTLSLFDKCVLLILFIFPTTLCAADLNLANCSDKFALVSSLPSVRLKGSPCAPVSYKDKLYCRTELLVSIFPSDPNLSIEDLITPQEPTLHTMPDGLIIAYLPDNVILLLDPLEKKAIKIFGGSNNHSPRDRLPAPIEILGFSFSFQKTMFVEALVEHEGMVWEPLRISTSSRIAAGLQFDQKEYRACLGNLCIDDVEIEIGRGLQLPVIVSEPNKILAMVLRIENIIVLFDASTNKIICKERVGKMALQPAVLGNILFAPSMSEKLMYRYDLTKLLAAYGTNK